MFRQPLTRSLNFYAVMAEQLRIVDNRKHLLEPEAKASCDHLKSSLSANIDRKRLNRNQNAIDLSSNLDLW